MSSRQKQKYAHKNGSRESGLIMKCWTISSKTLIACLERELNILVVRAGCARGRLVVHVYM
jgi:hypothetical protein